MESVLATNTFVLPKFFFAIIQSPQIKQNFTFTIDRPSSVHLDFFESCVPRRGGGGGGDFLTIEWRINLFSGKEKSRQRLTSASTPVKEIQVSFFFLFFFCAPRLSYVHTYSTSQETFPFNVWLVPVCPQRRYLQSRSPDTGVTPPNHFLPHDVPFICQEFLERRDWSLLRSPWKRAST